MTRNTEHGTGNTPPDTPMLRLRSATFDGRSVELADTHGTENTEHPNGTHGTQNATAERNPKPSLRNTFRAFRQNRSRSAEQAAADRRNAEALRNAQQNAEENAERQRQENARNAAARAAVRARSAARASRNTGSDGPEIAPVPGWMRWVGVWVQRTFGELPVIAPLVASGYFTSHVFHDAPVGAPWALAIVVTLALEGGVYKLVNLLVATLLEGDSTLPLRVGINFYLAVISGLIYWHALQQQAFKQGVPLGDAKIGWDWLPAAGCAAFSLLGVYIAVRDARFKHRVKLREEGRVDKQVPKFSAASWVFCPWETFSSLRHAVRYRLVSPLVAVEDWRYWKECEKPKIWPIVPDQEDGLDGTPSVPGTLFRGTVAEIEDALMGNAEQLPTERSVAAVPSRAALPSAERSATPAGAEHLTVTERVTAFRAERNTEHLTEHGTARNTDGVAVHHAADNGTRSAEPAVPQNVPSTDGTRNSAEDIPLNFAEHVLAITEAFPRWQEEMPSVRKAKAALDSDWKSRGKGGFTSQSITVKVIGILRTLQDDPDIAQGIARMRAHRTH